MPLTKLIAANFKGIRDRQEFDLARLTLFIGQNSSGKSTAIHALAALAQTMRATNNAKQLVLDDEQALVHLGRFIEIIHTGSYQDEMVLGLSCPAPTTKRKPPLPVGEFTTEWSFKSSQRTQEVSVTKARITSTSRTFTVRERAKGKGTYEVVEAGTSKKYEATANSGLSFEIKIPALKGDAEFREFIDRFNDFGTTVNAIRRELQNTLYLGPFRQAPLRRYPTRGSSPTEVGPQGEATVTLLANEATRTQMRTCTKQVSKWLGELGLAKSVEVKRVGKSDLFDVNITLVDSEQLPIADLGYGLSQVLPVLAQCAFSPAGSTLLFEQPELHLHEGAARRLARVFAQVCTTKTIVAETHSRQVVHEVLQLIREGKIGLSDVAIYDVVRQEKHSKFVRVEITRDTDGSIDIDHPWGKALEE